MARFGNGYGYEDLNHLAFQRRLIVAHLTDESPPAEELGNGQNKFVIALF